MVKTKEVIISVIIFIIVVGIISTFFLEKIPNFPVNISLPEISFLSLPDNIDIPFIAFVFQLIILLIIICFTYLKFLQHRRNENIHLKIKELPKKKSRSETDLDILYRLLQEQKILSVRVVSNLFNISKEKALEWGKILENHELAIINYPSFNVPEIKIKEEQEDEEEKQERKEKENPEGKGKERRTQVKKD